MIVWLNGAYGVGKSTIAAELVRRRPETLLLYDPEPIGYYLRDIVGPAERAGDYQELAIFTPVILDVARRLCQQYHQRSLVMPLGVWRPGQAAQIRDGLRRLGEVRHYCLTATRATINRRLAYRGDGQQAMTWIRQRLDECMNALQTPQFSKHIATDDLAPGEVVQQILEEMNGG